ncbi:methyltransferase domain-containing protein [uncultured Bartonella sp.]|uniref:methyltransferase domain-containing protein n=1 Tax=uncultured Bartonella sp. TaxID=104108 RepID=UPI00260E66E3|nr:methyltransferase domain-containing protein [uncultured Bartonella sp.]
MKTNKSKLEHFYNLGLALEKQGNFDKAADAYRQALAIDPEDFGGIRVRLASIDRGETPVTASKAYVATLFDQNADMFDYILVDQLGYDVPLQLREEIIKVFRARKFQKMLDLGCGTGLSGDALEDIANEKTGVDLSENMIEIAHEKGDYQKLFVGDVVDFVLKAGSLWDLIVATDVLPYMGDIKVFFSGVSKCLEKNGVFGFSTETLHSSAFDGHHYKVGPYQRFAHQQAYIEEMLAKNALECLTVNNIVVRAEQGEPVTGQLFLARKQ